MKQAYTDTSTNILYLREDGLLFVQLSRQRRDAIKDIQVGTFCLFEQPHSYVKGTVYEVTTTGVVLGGWEVKSCRSSKCDNG